MSTAAAEIIISGVVQGVGYRYFCLRTAQTLNLVGWVKNNIDSSVVTFVEGDSSAIEAYITELKIGPRTARVTNLEIIPKPFSGEHNRFEIKM